MSDMVIKGPGPGSSLVVTGRSEEAVRVHVDVNKLADVKLGGGSATINVAGTANANLSGSVHADASVAVSGNVGVTLAGLAAVRIAGLPLITLRPDITITLRLFGRDIGEIHIGGSARVES